LRFGKLANSEMSLDGNRILALTVSTSPTAMKSCISSANPAPAKSHPAAALGVETVGLIRRAT